MNAGDYNIAFSHTRTLIFGDNFFNAPTASTPPALVTQTFTTCAGTLTCATTFTATTGDEIIVAFHDAGDSCAVPPTVTDSLTNSYTNLLCNQSGGGDISLAIFGTSSKASGADTVTTKWTTVFSSTVAEYSGVGGIGATNAATGTGTGTFTGTVTLTAATNSAVFEAFTTDSKDVGATCATNTFAAQNSQVNIQSLCQLSSQAFYLNEWNSINPPSTNFGIQNTGVCTTGCPWNNGVVDLLGTGGTPSTSSATRWNFNSTCVTLRGPSPREADFDWTKGIAGSGGANCNSANIMISKSQVNFQTAAGRMLEIIWMAASLNSTNTQSVDLVFRTNATLPSFTENYAPFNDTNAKMIYEVCTRFSTVCAGSGQTIYIQHDPNKNINTETRANDFVVSGPVPNFKNNAPDLFQAVLNFTGPLNYINEETASSTNNNSNNTASALQMGQSYNLLIKVNTIGAPTGTPAAEVTNTFGSFNNIPAPLSIWSVPPACADPINKVACGLGTPTPIFQFNPLDPSSWGNAIIQGLLWVFTVAVPSGLKIVAAVLLQFLAVTFNFVGNQLGWGNIGDNIVTFINGLPSLFGQVGAVLGNLASIVSSVINTIIIANLLANPYFAGLVNILNDIKNVLGAGLVINFLTEIAIWFPTSYMIILIATYFLFVLLKGLHGFFDWIHLVKWSSFQMVGLFSLFIYVFGKLITAMLGRMSIISPGHEFPHIPHPDPGELPKIHLNGEVAFFDDPTAWFLGFTGFIFTMMWAGTSAAGLPANTQTIIQSFSGLFLTLFGVGFMILMLYIPGFLLGKLYQKGIIS